MGVKSMTNCCEFYEKLEALLEEYNVGGLSETSPEILVALIREWLRAWNLGIALRNKESEALERENNGE